MLRAIAAFLIIAANLQAADDENGKFEKFNLSARLPLLSVAPGPDGKQVAIAAGDFTVRTWDVVKGEELMPWKAHDHPAIHRVAFSPDGKGVFSCCEDSTVRRWDPTTGKEIREFKSHSVGVKSLAVSPDNKQLLTAGADATLRLFDHDRLTLCVEREHLRSAEMFAWHLQNATIETNEVISAERR